MCQVKILKLAFEQENQKTPQKRQSYNQLIESTQIKTLINRKGLKNIDRTSIGLGKSHGILINENLTPTNDKIAFHCRELKRNSRINKRYSRDGILQIVSKDVENGKKIKVIHMNTLHDRFPDFDFGEDAREVHNDSLQSSY